MDEISNPKGVTGRSANLEDKILLDKQNANIDPILKALRFVGRFESAIELLEKLEKEGLQVKVTHYNSAIKACGEVGNWEAALSLFEQIQTKRVSRDFYTYGILTDILWEFCDDASVRIKAIEELGRAEGVLPMLADASRSEYHSSTTRQ